MLQRWRGIVLTVCACAPFGLLVHCVGSDPAVVVNQGSNDASSGDGSSGDGAGPGSDSGDTSNDAGVDGDAGTPTCDAKVSSTATGTVQCILDAGCTTGSGSPICCYSSTVNPSRCYTTGATCAALRFSCDKQADCNTGEVCCLGGTPAAGSTCPYAINGATGSQCVPAATGCATSTAVELCSPLQVCPMGRTCQPLKALVVSDSTYTRMLGACL